MSSFSRIWLHMVFVTKYRAPLIKIENEKPIYDFMRDKLQEIECVPLNINGMPDHVHLLFLANHKMAPSDIGQRIKGSCSHWINSNKALPDKFQWADSFSVFSVSDALVGRTRNYIELQKRHHTKITFQQECDQLLKEHEGTIRKYTIE